MSTPIWPPRYWTAWTARTWTDEPYQSRTEIGETPSNQPTTATQPRIISRPVLVDHRSPDTDTSKHRVAGWQGTSPVKATSAADAVPALPPNDDERFGYDHSGTDIGGDAEGGGQVANMHRQLKGAGREISLEGDHPERPAQQRAQHGHWVLVEGSAGIMPTLGHTCGVGQGVIRRRRTSARPRAGLSPPPRADPFIDYRGVP